MGKKQHQKDKLYLTCTEWSTLYGGKRDDSAEKDKFRRLPFHCCSLSLQPFENPLCTKDGIIFDLLNIVPFLKKYGLNPITGEVLSAKDLIKLQFHKNSSGSYHCPVTYKIFNQNAHIVAVKPTGNVFAYEAVERLNIKPGFWKDLLTDEPFTRKDLITIQDPTNLDKFNISNFYHLKHKLELTDEDEEKAKKNPKYYLKAINSETRDVLEELDREYKAPEKVADVKKKADTFNAAHYSTGRVAASFTSTAAVPETEHETAIIDEDIIRYERVKKKGYIQMVTSKGPLNLELHCDMVPKTCENFMKHCINGYYNSTLFHRSIRNFMIQGGDPTGTGKGGESIWGGEFKDELKPNLIHQGRGILSMANTGPNTNKSQFFITFRSCRHLDGKHTVFGRVVGGIETLDKMEKVETDKLDSPVEEMRIVGCSIYVNPYDEADEQLKTDREKVIREDENKRKAALVKPKKEEGLKEFRPGVGKYINPIVQKRAVQVDTPTVLPKKQKASSSGFGNFSSW